MSAVIAQKRGEQRARMVIARIKAAGFVPEFSRVGREWGVGGLRETDEHREAFKDLLLFGVAHPRCYATLVRLMREEGSCTIRMSQSEDRQGPRE